MGDLSERHGELLECGCEFAQGTWFYCPEHLPLPGPPLDLRAVEARLAKLSGRLQDRHAAIHEIARDVPALLTHCRVLRAALTGVKNFLEDEARKDARAAVDAALAKNAVAVLAQAKDGPA